METDSQINQSSGMWGQRNAYTKLHGQPKKRSDWLAITTSFDIARSALFDILGRLTKWEISIPFLIVEDEPLIAMDLQAELEDRGEVAVVAASYDEMRLAISHQTFTWVLLDLNLGKNSVLPMAEELHAAGTKICFLTGSDVPKVVLDRLDATLFSKPVNLKDVMDHVLT